MKKTLLDLGLLLCLLVCYSFTSGGKAKVLVFYKTAGYRHSSIPNGVEAIKKIGVENNFDVDTSSDAALFTDARLKQYATLIFLNTTGTLFDSLQKEALRRYIQGGGGFVGVHAATDTEYNWPWYGKMVGGYFESHPKQQQARLTVVDKTHAATRDLPEEWIRFDEWYNFKNLNKDVRVLITIDETSYQGGKNGDYHPVSWWHHFEGGRVFYTALGHTEASYAEPLFLKHLTGGILYAMGADKKTKLANSRR